MLVLNGKLSGWFFYFLCIVDCVCVMFSPEAGCVAVILEAVGSRNLVHLFHLFHDRVMSTSYKHRVNIFYFNA